MNTIATGQVYRSRKGTLSLRYTIVSVEVDGFAYFRTSDIRSGYKSDGSDIASLAEIAYNWVIAND